MKLRERGPRALWPALVALAVLTAPPAVGATLSFVPASAEIACEEELVVDVVVDGVADLRGFSLVLEFDPGPVQLLAVEPGPLLTGAACPSFFEWLNAAAVGDSIAFDGAGLGCSVAGPGSIARLRFEGQNVDGLSGLRCRRTTLRNSLNLAVPASCGSADILVSCPVPAATSGWGVWKARAAGARG